MPTTYNQFDYPAATDAPDGPGAIFTLATQFDARLGTGGAEAVASTAAMVALPAARVFAGKRAYIASVGGGIFFRYNGTQWFVEGPADRMTSTQRLALNATYLWDGYEVIETDTNWRWRYTGGAWVAWDTPWVRVTDATLSPAFPTGYATAGGGSTPGMRRSAGSVELRGTFQKTAGGNMVQGESYWTLPTGWRPPATVYQFANGSGLQYGALMIDSGGVLGNYSLKGTTPTWWSLDGWRFAPA